MFDSREGPSGVDAASTARDLLGGLAEVPVSAPADGELMEAARALESARSLLEISSARLAAELDCRGTTRAECGLITASWLAQQPRQSKKACAARDCVFEVWANAVTGVARQLDVDGGHDPAGDLARNRLDLVPHSDGLVIHGELVGEVSIEVTGRFPAELLPTLRCDDKVRALVLSSGGVPLHMGRQVRLASPAQRTAIHVRDGGCVVPGWNMHAHVDQTISWTTPSKRTLLSQRHGRVVHRAGTPPNRVDTTMIQARSRSHRAA